MYIFIYIYLIFIYDIYIYMHLPHLLYFYFNIEGAVATSKLPCASVWLPLHQGHPLAWDGEEFSLQRAHSKSLSGHFPEIPLLHTARVVCFCFFSLVLFLFAYDAYDWLPRSSWLQRLEMLNLCCIRIPSHRCKVETPEPDNLSTCEHW